MRLSAIIIALTAATATLYSSSTAVSASGLHGWKVANIAWDDALNIRKYPSSNSQILTAYQSGVKLSLTGRCTKGLNLDDLNYPSEYQLKQAVRYRWCEVWINPAGDYHFVTGWAYGKYIEPNN